MALVLMGRAQPQGQQCARLRQPPMLRCGLSLAASSGRGARRQMSSRSTAQATPAASISFIRTWLTSDLPMFRDRLECTLSSRTSDRREGHLKNAFTCPLMKGRHPGLFAQQRLSIALILQSVRSGWLESSHDRTSGLRTSICIVWGALRVMGDNPTDLHLP